ncbi:MAG TPA: aspartate/glutamate racemase family protein [Candidatus Mediterraneibacter cottocaccae]|nr:aspartate/glutamate racemase family protein [Candidatus Mediterraneibacter cottocaccae]
MKVALVYTSTTPELINLVNEEVKKQLGEDVEILSYEDPTILSEIREHGYVTTAPAARLIKMFMDAALDGADAILNICSSVGETADCIQDAARYIGVPVVRIDEDMCRDAIRRGSRIGVMATLPTTLNPTKNTLLRLAREMNREIVLIDSLADGAFGLDQDKFRDLLLSHAEQIRDQVDIILLCQGSMAYCEEYLEKKTGIPVVSSPRYGAAALKKALQDKGLAV